MSVYLRFGKHRHPLGRKTIFNSKLLTMLPSFLSILLASTSLAHTPSYPILTHKANGSCGVGRSATMSTRALNTHPSVWASSGQIPPPTLALAKHLTQKDIHSFRKLIMQARLTIFAKNADCLSSPSPRMTEQHSLLLPSQPSTWNGQIRRPLLTQLSLSTHS